MIVFLFESPIGSGRLDLSRESVSQPLKKSKIHISGRPDLI